MKIVVSLLLLSTLLMTSISGMQKPEHSAVADPDWRRRLPGLRQLR